MHLRYIHVEMRRTVFYFLFLFISLSLELSA
jgi:imidazolonepropionase-like amidohydrolase